MPDVNRRLSVLADNEPFAPDCRFRLSGTMRTGLFPSLFLLECRNLSDMDIFRLRNTKELSVLREDSCLASGRVSDGSLLPPAPAFSCCPFRAAILSFPAARPSSAGQRNVSCPRSPRHPRAAIWFPPGCASFRRSPCRQPCIYPERT